MSKERRGFLADYKKIELPARTALGTKSIVEPEFVPPII